jgi:tRNA G10  N-methylase Trm11
MKKVFFILGRNPELSRTEILEFLKARNREHKEIFFEQNLLILETNEDEKFNIQEFGGTIHLGKILQEGNEEQIENYINKTEIIPSDKFSYTIFGNQDPQILKNKFKQQKKKAMIKHGGKQIKFQSGEKQELPKADFQIFFHKHKDTTKSTNPKEVEASRNLGVLGKETVYLGIANQTYDNTNVKKRDMQKPIRRESLAISPRLSKILINLSGAKPHDKLLDPFCGIGGILQEALIKKINVYGIDKDKQATIDAEKNLKWLTSEYNIQNKYKIENEDAKKTPDLQFSAIATETPLGKLLRKKPNDNEAKQIILNFEAYMIPILKKLKKVKKPSAKIAITFPVIRSLHTDVHKIAEKTGLKIYINPINESRPDQFISRDILVLQ